MGRFVIRKRHLYVYQIRNIQLFYLADAATYMRFLFALIIADKTKHVFLRVSFNMGKLFRLNEMYE